MEGSKYFKDKEKEKEIRRAIQSGNFAVDTPKSELRKMFPGMSQWRIDRMGIENLSGDVQEYIKTYRRILHDVYPDNVPNVNQTYDEWRIIDEKYKVGK